MNDYYITLYSFTKKDNSETIIQSDFRDPAADEKASATRKKNKEKEMGKGKEKEKENHGDSATSTSSKPKYGPCETCCKMFSQGNSFKEHKATEAGYISSNVALASFFRKYLQSKMSNLEIATLAAQQCPELEGRSITDIQKQKLFGCHPVLAKLRKDSADSKATRK